MTLRHQLAGSAAIVALVQLLSAAPAIAQFAPTSTAPTGADSGVPGAGPAENIVVTGSRIKTTNATADNPVTVVTAAQIEHTGAQTIEDVLQQLPAIGTSGLYGATNNGGEGASCTDIRNLGITRTLVLVDGKRFVHSGILGADCVDLNNLPLSLVDRIEVLKDGASTTYGADAVAGVVNIILKHNFSGTVFKADGSIGSDSGDGRTGDLSVTTGTNFDKGNLVVSAEYENRAPVEQRNYDWSSPVHANDPLPGGKLTFGSGIPPNGRIFQDTNNITPGPNLSGDDYALGNGNIAPYNRSQDGYDYGQQQYLAGSLEKESFTAFGNYDFTPNIQGYVQTFFTHKRTDTQLAPQPVTGALVPNSAEGLPDYFVVPQGNPYLSQIYGAGSGAVDLYRRVSEFGDRDNIASTNTFQINTGFKGSFAGDWDYDVFFQYGQSDNTITSTNEVNFQRLEQEVGFQSAIATPGQIANITAVNGGFDPLSFGVYNPTVCTSQPGCVLINPFGPNSISAAGVNYARFTETATSSFSLRTFGGTLTNSNLLQLPYGPLGLSLGVEHRRESGSYTPDALVQSGVTLENAQNPTNGAFDVTELYGELLIPLVKDVPFVKDLHLNVGGRFFNYSTFGSGETWKVSANYTIIPDIRLRATDGVAFREPSVTEAFGGQTLGFPGANDPCANVANYPGQQAAVIANCSKYIHNYNPNTFTQQGNNQVQTISGGNPLLSPETARTQTFGVIFTPRFLPRSDVTVDYYRTKIDNSVGSIGTQQLLDGCYTGQTPQFCGAPFNGSARVNGNQIGTLTSTLENLGVTRESGLDIGASYSYPINGYGVIAVSNDAAIVFKYDEQNVPGGPFVGYNGSIITSEYGSGYPRLRDNVAADWRIGDFSFGYRMRYISGMNYYASIAPNTAGHTRTDEVFYHDVNFSYDYRNIALNVGVDNLFDKAPPFVFDASTNTDPQVYDVLGRVVYLKTTLRF